MLNGIFNNPAFNLENLTASFNVIPYLPTQARSLPIWSYDPIATTTVDMEYDAVKMELIPTSLRGGPPTNVAATKRTLRTLKTVHLQLMATIKPSEVQNVREFGTANQLRTAISVVNRRMQPMALSHDATLEYQSIGAIKGVVYDADGSTVIENFFTWLGISQTSVDFDLGDLQGKVKRKCLQVKRAMETAIEVGPGQVRVQCFCGNDFFDAFVQHPEVADAYKLYQANNQLGQFLRDDNRSGFPFAGIWFENYVGSVSGVDFVAAGEAHFFPLNVPGMFRTAFSPADTIDTANTPGLPRYAMGERMDFGRGLQLLTESDPLAYCARPAALIKGTSSTWPAGIDTE